MPDCSLSTGTTQDCVNMTGYSRCIRGATLHVDCLSDKQDGRDLIAYRRMGSFGVKSRYEWPDANRWPIREERGFKVAIADDVPVGKLV